MLKAPGLILLTCSFLIGLPSLSSGTSLMNKNLILILTLRLCLRHHLTHLILILLIATFCFALLQYQLRIVYCPLSIHNFTTL